MRVLSLFSGIEAATVAFAPLGWQVVAVAEIEPFPCAVLAHHYPDVPKLGDVSKITREQVAALGRIDMVCGGFPCQDLSVAGKRKGLKHDDGSSTRSGLFFDAMRVVEWANPRWLLVENVPGMFSSNRGRDFAAVVGEMAGCGFDVPADGWRNAGVAVGPRGLVEWATLDAQFFGLAQRRNRVFLVRDSGAWADRPPVLLEPESLRGDPAPRREAGQDAAATVAGGARKRGGYSHDDAPMTALAVDLQNALLTEDLCGTLDAEGQQRGNRGHGVLAFGGNRTGGPIDVTPALLAQPGSGWKGDFESETFIAFDTAQVTSAANRSAPKPGDPCHPLAAGAHAPAIAFSAKDHGADATLDLSPTLRAGGHANSHANADVMPAVQQAMTVRRLTPRECERLQGFRDDYTSIPRGGKPAADGPRYRALGNSWAVPCVSWIARRIEAAMSVRAAA
jgi:DNA (cytosine-5)-methyltransferase 1